MHKFTDFTYIFLTIIFTVYGQVVMKWRLENLHVKLPENIVEKLPVLIKLLFDPFIFSGIVFAFFASLSWMIAMTKFELSFAYPFMALNFVLVLILSLFFLGETFSFAKLFGVLLIFFGTIVLSRS